MAKTKEEQEEAQKELDEAIDNANFIVNEIASGATKEEAQEALEQKLADAEDDD